MGGKGGGGGSVSYDYWGADTPAKYVSGKSSSESNRPPGLGNQDGSSMAAPAGTLDSGLGYHMDDIGRAALEGMKTGTKVGTLTGRPAVGAVAGGLYGAAKEAHTISGEIDTKGFKGKNISPRKSKSYGSLLGDDDDDGGGGSLGGSSGSSGPSGGIGADGNRGGGYGGL
jgi:hypothetical protein